MNRRLILAALGLWPMARAFSQADEPRPRLRISAAQLHESLSTRFPVRMGLAGLLEVEVSAPQLHLLPARNLLGAGLVAQVGGLQLQPLPPGELDVAFALRWEGSDRSVRAHKLEVLDLRWPGMPPETLLTLRRVLPQLAQEAVGEFVLRRFSERELALADTMGFEPERLTVQQDGLLVVFGPKGRR